MSTLQVGQTFTSQKSGYTGVIEEIVPQSNGSFRVRFESGRWTTVS